MNICADELDHIKNAPLFKEKMSLYAHSEDYITKECYTEEQDGVYEQLKWYDNNLTKYHIVTKDHVVKSYTEESKTISSNYSARDVHLGTHPYFQVKLSSTSLNKDGDPKETVVSSFGYTKDSNERMKVHNYSTMILSDAGAYNAQIVTTLEYKDGPTRMYRTRETPNGSITDSKYTEIDLREEVTGETVIVNEKYLATTHPDDLEDIYHYLASETDKELVIEYKSKDKPYDIYCTETYEKIGDKIAMKSCIYNEKGRPTIEYTWDDKKKLYHYTSTLTLGDTQYIVNGVTTNALAHTEHRYTVNDKGGVHFTNLSYFPTIYISDFNGRATVVNTDITSVKVCTGDTCVAHACECDHLGDDLIEKTSTTAEGTTLKEYFSVSEPLVKSDKKNNMMYTAIEYDGEELVSYYRAVAIKNQK